MASCFTRSASTLANTPGFVIRSCNFINVAVGIRYFRIFIPLTNKQFRYSTKNLPEEPACDTTNACLCVIFTFLSKKGYKFIRQENNHCRPWYIEHPSVKTTIFKYFEKYSLSTLAYNRNIYNTSHLRRDSRVQNSIEGQVT